MTEARMDAIIKEMDNLILRHDRVSKIGYSGKGCSTYRRAVLVGRKIVARSRELKAEFFRLKAEQSLRSSNW